MNIAEKAQDKGILLGSLDKISMWKDLEFRKCFFKPIIENIENQVHGKKNKYEDYERYSHIVEAYKKGDEGKLISIFESDSKSKSSDKCIIDQRNKNWISVIEKAHHHHSPVFFAAGVAHTLVVPNNLITLLRGKGFQVERVPSP